MSTSLGRWLGDDIAAPMFLDVTSQCQGREFHCYTPPMPRISEATIAEHRRRTETDLLDAWGSLMSEHGYADITLTLVAEHAGVARNTVYGYFADKEALLLAYLDREVARFMEQASAAIRAEESAADRLRVLIELQTRYFAATAASGQELAGVLNPHSFGQMSAAFTPLLDMITQIIRTDGTTAPSVRSTSTRSRGWSSRCLEPIVSRSPRAQRPPSRSARTSSICCSMASPAVHKHLHPQNNVTRQEP